MQTVEELIQMLLSTRSSELHFGKASPFNASRPHELYFARVSGNVTALCFSEEAYARFCAAFGQLLFKKAAPVEVQEKLLAPEQVPTIGGLKPHIDPGSSATRFRSRVLLPVRVLSSIVRWLNGMIGGQGETLRNQLSRNLPSPTLLNPRPAPAAGDAEALVLGLPAEPEPEVVGETAESFEQFGNDIALLRQLFDVVVVYVKALPGSKELEGIVADGKDGNELFGSEDEPPTIWIVRDASGFHAALIGPTFAAAYERRLVGSYPEFCLPNVGYAEVRKRADLRALLHPSGAVGEGCCALTWWNRRTASLVSLPLLMETLGLDKLKD